MDPIHHDRGSRLAQAALALLLALVTSSLGCSPTPATVLVVRVESDMTPVTELAAVRVVVRREGASEPPRDQRFDLQGGRYVLPGEVAVVPLDPSNARRVIVQVTAELAGGGMFTQQAVTTIAPEQRTLLQMVLLRRCRSMTCPTGQSCGYSGCEPEQRSAAPYTPAPPRDASTDDTPAAVDTGVPGEASVDAPIDAAVDAPVEPDAPAEASVDAAADLPTEPLADVADEQGADDVPADAGEDVPFDATADVAAMDVTVDVGVDAGVDVTPDAGVDVGVDVPQDVPVDTGVDVAPDVPPDTFNGDLPIPSECTGTTSLCSGACVDFSNNAQHCGGCNRPCGASQNCVNRSCRCTGTLTLCGTACVDLATDRSHCGACGTVCRANETCVGAACGCNAPSRLCGGSCVDPQVSVQHCGACSAVCGLREHCSGGACDPVTTVGIAASDGHACAWMSDGTARCWGSNFDGQLGTSVTGNVALSPVRIPDLQGVTRMFLGPTFTCARVGPGPLRCLYRRLGVFAPFEALADIEEVALSDNHGCVRLGDGTVRCAGNNGLGQLGDGTNNVTSAVVNPGLRDVVQVAVGPEHSCALTSEGRVYCWGDHSLGQLGIGTVGGEACPNNPCRRSPTELPGLSGVLGIACAGRSCCARLAIGLRCWGHNASGTLGYGDTTRRDAPGPVIGGLAGAAQVAATRSGTLCARLSNTVQCWGYGGNGQIGDGFAADRYAPTAVTGLSDATSVVFGRFTACALRSDGSVACWGAPYIGDGSSTQRNVPTAVMW